MNAKAEKRDLRKVYDNAYKSIEEMVTPLLEDDTHEPEAMNRRDAAEQAIREDALSCQVRSGWVDVGETMTADEFCLLLGTGGPAVRIMGELNQHGEPQSARLEVQDWFEPWTDFETADESVLLAYCSVFYFGEGQ